MLDVRESVELEKSEKAVRSRGGRVQTARKASESERRSKGKTTVLSTHMMHQVEALCDRVALIHHGKLVVYGRLDEIRRRYSPNEVIVWTSMDLIAFGVRAEEHKAGGWRIKLPPSETPAGYLHELVRSGVLIDRYEPLVARMDEIFVSLVGGGR